jgi:hypothetical protein
METVIFFLAFAILALLAVLYFLYPRIQLSPTETIVEGYEEKFLNTSAYRKLREISNNPEKVNKISRRQLSKHLKTLVRGRETLNKDTYSQMVVMLISSKKISKKKLVWLWNINLNNYIVRETIARHTKLPEETRTLYSLWLIAEDN